MNWSRIEQNWDSEEVIKIREKLAEDTIKSLRDQYNPILTEFKLDFFTPIGAKIIEDKAIIGEVINCYKTPEGYTTVGLIERTNENSKEEKSNAGAESS